ncbi:Uma2 family endonuclease [Microcoleus sp. CAWBG58]|uniref:Uma2 family endonuclease n=1 Tax=Microcoleus sp. CAWBG58 TaxID=2841651 RepID=UPI0025EC96B3|nr:Uma2 family endonuclease [Microcoleus sp. CAWBG58]
MLTIELDTLLKEQALQRQDSEERYITDTVNWEQYQTLLNRIGDTAGYRVTYLDGVLEIMSPSRRHENGKTRIGNLLEIYFVEADIEYFPFGSTTLRKEEKSSGTEPDEAYCIGTDKEFPDLVIEVIVTSGSIDKLELYRRLNVQEVWFWRNERFSIYHLREEIPVEFVSNCGYELITQSELLPELDIEMLAECVKNPHPLAAAKAWRQTLR